MKGIAKIAAGGVALLASCGEPASPADTEVAAELRALRAVLVQQQRSAAGANATVPNAVPDRGQITTALQPLREVLDGLVQSQRELQARQVTLTQEMQRWSQLLVETATGARQEEAKAMTQRLQQLEKSLQEQDTRHREVEALMQGALDRTADRLEDFLRRLEGTVRPGTERPPDPAGAPAGTAPIKSAPPDPASNGGNGLPAGGSTPPSTGGGEDDASGSSGNLAAVRPARHWSTSWWMLPAVLAASLCVAFFLRLRRLSNQSFVATASPRAGPEHVEATREPELDRGVQEIWAAAALLGEAVGRLKQTAPSEASPPPAPAVANHDGVGMSEVVSVLGDEVSNGAVPPAPAVAETATARLAPARASSMNQPRNTAVRCRLPGISAAQAQAEVVRLLADDSRVLRRPEPVMTTTPTALEVAFHVLPGLPASERSQIEQRLRDAVAEPAASSASWVSQRAGGVAIVLPPFPPSEQHHA